MKIDKETQEKIQELQLAEQNLQSFLLQKQAFQLELQETDSAIEEVKKSENEIYKIISQVMIKVKKPEILKELEDKKAILNLRLKAIENQQKIIGAKLEKTKKEVEEKLKNNS